MAEPRIHVELDVGAPGDELEAVTEVFRGVGLDAEVRPGIIEHSAEPGPWVADVVTVGEHAILFIAAIFGAGAAAVGVGFAQKAGEDAWDEFRESGWRGLERFMRELTSARGGEGGRLTMRGVGHADVSLHSGLPDEAYEELAQLDWEQLSGGSLGWSEENGDWWWLPPGGRAARAPRANERRPGDVN